MRIRSNTYQKVCHLIASNIRDLVKTHTNPVLGLATGTTPIGIYQELSKMKNTNFSDTITFNLDEYVGLNGWHPQSYNHFMYEHLFGNLTFYSKYFPTKKLYPYYDTMIDNVNGIDIQILGIGTNGHIAFNEPGTPRDSVTRIVDLTESTIKDNSRFFDSIEEVPTQAYTMGIETIMKSKRIYLVAKGEHKKEILEKAIYGEITPEVPASFLQEHPNIKVFYCD
jgi:glucosamine-6-phosphate deaminase|tara:strand:- start:2494 stop:3165 length:672 start_codon:yes stop_codon:yes gene_type:complete